jgi:hypothetical protein
MKDFLKLLIANAPFTITIVEGLLLEMKKKALDYKIHLNDLIEECWRCFLNGGDCEVKEKFKKGLKK